MLIMFLFGVSDPNQSHLGTALRTRPTYIFVRGSYVGLKWCHGARPTTFDPPRPMKSRAGRGIDSGGCRGLGDGGPARIQAEATGMK